MGPTRSNQMFKTSGCWGIVMPWVQGKVAMVRLTRAQLNRSAPRRRCWPRRGTSSPSTATSRPRSTDRRGGRAGPGAPCTRTSRASARCIWRGAGGHGRGLGRRQGPGSPPPIGQPLQWQGVRPGLAGTTAAGRRHPGGRSSAACRRWPVCRRRAGPHRAGRRSRAGGPAAGPRARVGGPRGKGGQAAAGRAGADVAARRGPPGRDGARGRRPLRRGPRVRAPGRARPRRHLEPPHLPYVAPAQPCDDPWVPPAELPDRLTGRRAGLDEDGVVAFLGPAG